MGSSSVNVTLELYKMDGTKFVTPGTSYNGVRSTLIPDAAVTVAAYSTSFYHQSFGGLALDCNDRPFAGTITVSADSEVIMVASGFVSGTLGNTPIIINGGEPWKVGPSSDPADDPINDPVVDECSIVASDDLIPAMSSNTSEYGIASASSNDLTHNVQPFRAFDNACNNWSTAFGQTTGWLAYEFFSPKTVTKYTIRMKQGDPSHAFAQSPNSWIFEAWDGTNWIELDSQSNVTDWNLLTTKEFLISNTIAYSKYRIRFTANNGGSVVCISELGMMGY